jgi:chaperonin cofactor prefoldin
MNEIKQLRTQVSKLGTLQQQVDNLTLQIQGLQAQLHKIASSSVSTQNDSATEILNQVLHPMSKEEQRSSVFVLFGGRCLTMLFLERSMT